MRQAELSMSPSARDVLSDASTRSGPGPQKPTRKTVHAVLPYLCLGQAIDGQGQEHLLSDLKRKTPCCGQGIIKVLIERWETEDQADTMRKGTGYHGL